MFFGLFISSSNKAEVGTSYFWKHFLVFFPVFIIYVLYDLSLWSLSILPSEPVIIIIYLWYRCMPIEHSVWEYRFIALCMKMSLSLSCLNFICVSFILLFLIKVLNFYFQPFPWTWSGHSVFNQEQSVEFLPIVLTVCGWWTHYLVRFNRATERICVCVFGKVKVWYVWIFTCIKFRHVNIPYSFLKISACI